jgi:hypothetical protein
MKTIPGFTAEHSAYKAISYFRSKAARSVGSGTNENHVFLQKPNSKNTPGGDCHATTTAGDGGTISTGTYDSEGRCCGPKLSNGSQFCINCDGTLSTCDDGHAPTRGTHTFTFGNFQGGLFARI